VSGYIIIKDGDLTHLMEVIHLETEVETKKVSQYHTNEKNFDFIKGQFDYAEEEYTKNKKKEDNKLTNQEIDEEIKIIMAKADSSEALELSSKFEVDLLSAHLEVKNMYSLYQKKRYSLKKDESGRSSLFSGEKELTQNIFPEQKAEWRIKRVLEKHQNIIPNEIQKNINKFPTDLLVNFLKAETKKLEQKIQDGSIISSGEIEIVTAYLNLHNSALPTTKKEAKTTGPTHASSSPKPVEKRKVSFVTEPTAHQ
jgi:hypothetical protein